MRRIYEIWDENANEMLVDNLTFDEAAEQSAIYMEFFGNGIAVAIRESAPVRKRKTSAQEYKEAWIEYFGELQLMGNLN
jgi:hypothetical protein